MKAPTVLLGTLCSDSIKRNGVESTPYLGKTDTCLSLLPLLTLYRTDISVTWTLSAGPRCSFKRELIVMSTTGYPQWSCSSTAPPLTGRQFVPCSNTRGDARQVWVQYVACELWPCSNESYFAGYSCFTLSSRILVRP